MRELRERGLDAAVREVAARGTPLLGICLGMQMLLDESEEFGVTAGLGLINGRVIPVPAVTIEGAPQKRPHIGWSALVRPAGRESWDGALLGRVKQGDAVYFVHSYMADPTDGADRLADCVYGGHHVPAVIGRGNVFGCQFHPEKSGPVGLNVLRSFLSL
jgi:glutamine amidotransferase